MVRHRAAWKVQLRGLGGSGVGEPWQASLDIRRLSLAVSAFSQGTKKAWKLTERASWQESKGAEKGKTPSHWPLLFSIGTINTILKCYGNLRSLF